MLWKLIKIIRDLLGLDTGPSSDVEWLEDKVEESDKKLKEIEDEENTVDDVVNHFND